MTHKNEEQGRNNLTVQNNKDKVIKMLQVPTGARWRIFMNQREGQY